MNNDLLQKLAKAAVKENLQDDVKKHLQQTHSRAKAWEAQKPKTAKEKLHFIQKILGAK